jgi:hypothetical protein
MPAYHNKGEYLRENVSVNRGANVRAFTDLGDAMRWLDVMPSEE